LGWYSSRPNSEDIGVRVRMMIVSVFIIETTSAGEQLCSTDNSEHEAFWDSIKFLIKVA